MSPEQAKALAQSIVSRMLASAEMRDKGEVRAFVMFAVCENGAVYGSGVETDGVENNPALGAQVEHIVRSVGTPEE